MKPSGSLILEVSSWVDVEEEVEVNKRGKNVEKVFPVKGHKFRPTVRFDQKQTNISLMTFRPSVNQCFVPWTKTLFGGSENRSFVSFFHFQMDLYGYQGLSCEGCKMTLHKWCYNKVIDYCPKSV